MKKRKISSRLTLTALLALILVLSIAGVTLAWLVSRTEPIVNTFTLGEVTVEIPEEFDGDTKANVAVKNPDNGKTVPAYVRVALVPTWTRDADGKEPVGEPASLSDLNISFNTADWFMASDGYYYYRHILPPGMETTNLINTAIVLTEGNGYHMNLQVIADGVQAHPSAAVEEVWPAVKVAANGDLGVAS